MEGQGNSSYYYYSKIVGSAGKITTDDNYTLSSNEWVKDTETSQYDWQLTSTGWKQDNGCAAGESITYSTNSEGVTSVKLCNGITMNLTARTVDASGKTLEALGLKPPTAALKTATMPAGSQLIWFNDVNPEDEFRLYTGYQISKGSQSFTTLDDFVKAYTQPTSSGTSPSYILPSSGLYFSFGANGALTLFNSDYSPTKIPATYTRQRVPGSNVEVLTINTQAPNQDPGERIFFAVKGEKVYSGSYTPKGTASTSRPQFNKVMIDAIMKAAGKPPVKD